MSQYTAGSRVTVRERKKATPSYAHFVGIVAVAHPVGAHVQQQGEVVRHKGAAVGFQAEACLVGLRVV